MLTLIFDEMFRVLAEHGIYFLVGGIILASGIAYRFLRARSRHEAYGRRLITFDAKGQRIEFILCNRHDRGSGSTE